MNEHQKVSSSNCRKTSIHTVFMYTNVNLLFVLVCLLDKNGRFGVMIGNITCQNSQQRGNWDHFGSDWASFKYQLCWFCYADLATLTPCYIHLLSRKKAQKYIIPADVEWGGNGGRCLETCLETTRSDLCINYSYYYCTPVFTTSHIFCFQHSWTSLEVPPTLTLSSAQQKCT